MSRSSKIVGVADYVIVGAGTAGCVLANRLTEDATSTVIVLEAGGSDRPLHESSQFRSNVNVQIPAGFTSTVGDPNLDWNYQTEANPSTDGRTFTLARGKVFGGSSAINGMLYVRGMPQDYDGWRQLGAVGWGWEDVTPFFRRVENHSGPGPALSNTNGPVDICETPFRHIMSDRIRSAFLDAGVPDAEFVDGTVSEGVNFARVTQKRGLRLSSAAAYLHPALRRANLKVEKHALATRVIFEGARAVGVEFQRSGETVIVHARREVILAGGAINSPQLLELSGIGQPVLLSNHGIEVVAKSAGVGENLQDHYVNMARARLKAGTKSINSLTRGAGFLGQILRYAFTRSGLLTLGGAHLTAFLRSRPEIDLPDLQLFATPATIDFESLVTHGKFTTEREPGLSIGGYLMRPESRGSIHIRSADPRDHPAIIPNFLADRVDQRGAVDVLRWSRRVMRQAALAPYLAHELTPGAGVESDDELFAFARMSGATGYHQSGTCAIGTVVDERLRVIGVNGLRVVDASVMPRIISGNTGAATYMIGEKGADMIRADARSGAAN